MRREGTNEASAVLLCALQWVFVERSGML